MNTLIDFPEEDSPDLTDDEITGAVDASTSETMAEVFGQTRCSTCGGPVALTKHQLRKRAPRYYARILFVCKDGHQGSITFRARFLTPGGT